MYPVRAFPSPAPSEPSASLKTLYPSLIPSPRAVLEDTLALPVHRAHERCQCVRPLLASKQSPHPPTPPAPPVNSPFRLRFGSKTQLIILCFPQCRLGRPTRPTLGVGVATPRVGLDYGLHNLDRIITFLNEFNKRWTREHHPAFYDCDAGATGGGHWLRR